MLARLANTSLRQQSSNLTVRGRKLVLQYTNGSPCGPDAESSSLSKRAYEDDIYEGSDPSDVSGHATEPHDSSPSSSDSDSDDEKDDADATSRRKKSKHPMRKSATLSFHCERDPLKALAQASFVGTDPYQCAYFFEIRSPYACAGAPPPDISALGPGGVFVLIMAIAVAVYFAGGVMYNRSVGHARGWRQLPNYGFWSGLWSVISDIFVIATSSCARCLPGRKGYSSLSTSAERAARRGGRDDENRLIDDLDEEWDH